MNRNRQWILRTRPVGDLKDGDLELVETAIPAVGDDEVLIRTVYLSLDPTNRTWMNDSEGYLPPVQLGSVMRGLTLGVVEQSKSDRFAVGDVVTTAAGGWADYAVVPAAAVGKVHRFPGLPLTANMSVLGMTGMTAYFGVTDVLQPRAGETMVISAAAGAVGSIAGQIAKQKGARVIGIAGGPAKCAWLTEDLGFDAAIDYKAERVGPALDALAPDGVEMSFENVGGDIMNSVWNRMKVHGRIAVCGMISAYNATQAPRPPNLARLITHRMKVQGFLVLDYQPRAREMVAEMGPWLADGRVIWKVHVDEGLEGAVSSLNRLFTGAHDGKLLVRVSEGAVSDEFLVHFDDLEVGQVVNLGTCAVDAEAVGDFARRFAPGWDASQGAPDVLVYAYWSRLETDSAKRWARSKSLAVDALRFSRTPPAGELLRGRMTVMGKDPVGDERGVIIAQQDLLDEAGRLIFSCLTRAVFLRR